MELIGVAPAMRAALAQIATLPDDAVIHAERGAGARTFASAIHEHWRSEHPLVFVECAEAPPALLEAILCGHEKSSCFGPPRPPSLGAFEQAGAGTVVLVELAALPVGLQRHVLRVIDQRRVRRIGSNRFQPAPGRVIATTRRDPGELLASRRLHPELAALPIVRVPPLRERREDIAPLLAKFLGEAPPAVVERLAALPWPGNVAELAELASVLGGGISVEDALTERALLAAITSAPDDTDARLVYGDLLLARGNPLGELVQVQCKLARDREDAALLAAERALLDAHESTWLAPVLARPFVTAARHSCGLVEHVTAGLDALRDLDELLRLAPALRELEVDSFDADNFDGHTFDAPGLARLRTLRVRASGDLSVLVDCLALSPYLASVPELVLAPAIKSIRNILPEPIVLGADAARMLASTGIATLVLDDCSLDAAAIHALASGRLAKLVLTKPDLPADALAAVARSLVIEHRQPR